MKQSILFLLLLLISGCGHKPATSASDATTTVAILKHYGDIRDSIQDPKLRKLVIQDSIELLDVRHALSDTYHVEQVLYMDHHMIKESFIQNRKDVERNKGKILNWRSLAPQPSDSFMSSGIPNPFTEMDGAYLTVEKYKGKFVLSGWFTIIVTDTGIIEGGEMWSIDLYRKGEKEGNTLRYITENIFRDGVDTIEIRALKKVPYMQIWKQGGHVYSLKVPLERSCTFPEILTANNLGDGSDIYVELDKINLDSIFRANE